MTDSTDRRRWLVLAGYMGAGKSSVGTRVAERLGCAFVDADAAVVAAAGMEIPEIFKQRGELWFRRTETDVIREIVQGRPAGVLALGGGALGSARTRDLLDRVTDVVWLRVSPEVAWGRVEGSDRPLAIDRERFIRRAESREATYRDAAHATVDADRSLDDVVEAIVTRHAGVTS